jgi:hypothetical protein
MVALVKLVIYYLSLMKKFALFLFLFFGTALAADETNLPPDPFTDLVVNPKAPEYAVEVDRNRGVLTLNSADGQYVPGDHFAHWHWTAKPVRWGKYFVILKYLSTRSKLGVQVKVGDLPPLKSYAARTGREEVGAMVLGTVYIPKVQDYPVILLTGDQSNTEDFDVKGIEFNPAPEGETMGQSIDGSVSLTANCATTYSEKMRYEPGDAKNCLGFWTHEKDWAEWNFEITSPGEFEVKVVQGCGTGQGGSEVKVLVNGDIFSFKVEDTGGFQNWKEVSVGKVKLAHAGTHKLAVIPTTKAGEAVMDVHKLLLNPIGG